MGSVASEYSRPMPGTLKELSRLSLKWEARANCSTRPMPFLARQLAHPTEERSCTTTGFEKEIKDVGLMVGSSPQGARNMTGGFRWTHRLTE